MVVLTRNEVHHVQACLASLAAQRMRDVEVILIDAASTDGTLDVVRALETDFPLPLRIVAAPRPLPIGEARNLGVKLARAPRIAFLSADAELDPAWTQEALRSLIHYDMAFSRQRHAPNRWTVGAAVRGLRYRFPATVTPHPIRYASNVAAAYNAEVLRAFPFDAWANAAEDLRLARRAQAAGYRATYNPYMVVHHHDVVSTRDELRKNLREGHAWGRYRSDLGLFVPLLAWAALLAAALILAALRPGWPTFVLVPFLLWLPALRRAARHVADMPVLRLVQGVAASPFFDLAHLAAYIGGLFQGATHRASPTPPQETRT